MKFEHWRQVIDYSTPGVVRDHSTPYACIEIETAPRLKSMSSRRRACSAHRLDARGTGELAESDREPEREPGKAGRAGKQKHTSRART